MAPSARKQFTKCSRLTALLVFVGLWAVAPPASAQQGSAGVNGVVTDPVGAFVAGAQIDLFNVDTGVMRNTTANSDGTYLFINVVPGNYTVKVSKSGFSPVTESGVHLEVNQTATFDFHLKVGDTQTSVTVEASAAAVESSTSELGTVVNRQQVIELPLNGRNFTQLLTITPGVVNIHTDQSSGGGGGFAGNAIGSFAFPAVNGARVRSNGFLLDGINNLNTFLSMYNFQPIVDDIQEFKTQGHNDLAEYGGVTGGMVSVVSKSGTNDFHGTMWEFLRNEQLDARGFFNAARTPLRQNQFGLAGGGPVWIPKVYNGRNRTFFYAAYEGYRQRLFNEAGTLGATDAMRGGDFSALGVTIYDPRTTTFNAATNTYSRDPFAGNQIPSGAMSPLALAYQSLIPHAGALLNGNNIYIPARSSTNQDSGSVRADQYFGNSDQVMFRYSQYVQDMVTPNNVIGQSTSHIYGHNMAVHETHTFGPTSVLDVYFGRNFGDDVLTTSVPGENASFISNLKSLGMSTLFSTLGGAVYAPSVSLAQGYVSFPYQALQETGLADVWQFGGTFVKNVGRHTIKFGADFESNNFASPIGYANNSFATTQTAGLGANQGIGGNSWASFLLGIPNGAALRNVHEANHGGWSDAFFVQDQWKVSNRLTVNLGFRDEVKIQPIYGSGKDLYTGDADAVTGQYILTAVPPDCSATVGAPCMPRGIYASNGPSPYSGLPPHVIVASSNHRILQNSYGNWAGRLGLAFRLNDKTVLRGGYGRFYDLWGAVTQLAQNFGGNWPAVATINNPSLNQNSIVSSMGDPLSLGSGGGLVYPRVSFDQVSQWMVDPNFKTPYMDQWNFGVQRQLPDNTVLDVNYVGSVGRRLDWGPVQNVATPGPGDPTQRQPFPYMYPQWFDQSVGNSRYNALQVSVNKRASNGLAFLLSYTLSHATDDGCSADIGADCNTQNVYNRTQDVQVAAFNEKSVFSGSFTFQSPFGRPGHNSNKAVNMVAGGWQLNGILQLNSGLPYTVTTSTAILNNGGFNQERANVTGDPNSGGHTVAQWFNTAAFSNPAPYTFGNSKGNSMISDWGKNLDISLFRKFGVGAGEHKYFEFRAEAFNVLNNVVFNSPDANLTDSNFGHVTGQLNPPRELQLGLKFYF